MSFAKFKKCLDNSMGGIVLWILKSISCRIKVEPMSEKSLSQDFQTFHNDKLALAYQSVKSTWHVSLLLNVVQPVKHGMINTYFDFTISVILGVLVMQRRQQNPRIASLNIVVFIVY